MNLEGTVNKTGILLLICGASAAYAWYTPALQGPLIFAPLLGALVFCLIGLFKPAASPFVAPCYAALEGLVLGAASMFFNSRYPGIVANAVLLIGVATIILREAIGRIGHAPEVSGIPMIVVALAGLATNAAVALLLRSHSTQSLAVKGAYMEVIADTVGSIGVLIAGVVTITTHWPYADVVVAVLVAMWVLPRALSLAAGALRILSESSPSHIDVEELRAALGAVDGVTDVHDLHVWTLVPGKDMVTAHLASREDSARVLSEARAILARHGLGHATIQVEPPDGVGDCMAGF